MLWWSPVTGSMSRSTNEWREASVLHVTACYRRNVSPSAAGDRKLLLARRRRSRTANFIANLSNQNDTQCMLICYLHTCNWEGFIVLLQHSKVGSLSCPFQTKTKVEWRSFFELSCDISVCKMCLRLVESNEMLIVLDRKRTVICSYYLY
jgi:hypothetical protein